MVPMSAACLAKVKAAKAAGLVPADPAAWTPAVFQAAYETLAAVPADAVGWAQALAQGEPWVTALTR